MSASRPNPVWIALPIALLVSLAGLISAPTSAGMGAPGAGQESSSPLADEGSNANYRSYITTVTPDTHGGLGVQVLEFADRLSLRNRTGQTVTIYGYQGEPYARILSDGTAEQNMRSPATYLNKSFYGNTSPPPIADVHAAPEWKVLDRTGQFEWHDHRIHWPSPTLPPQVKDKGKRTLIFDWNVPIAVGGAKGAIYGQLFWVPNASETPLAAIVSGAVIAVGGLLFVLFVRRRRSRAEPPDGARGATTERPPREAW